MKSFVNILINEYKKNKIEEIYKWEIPSTCPITIPENCSNFEKNVYLKENLKTQLKKDYLNTAYWIINVWGGIKGFKQNEKNDEILIAFRKKIEEGINTLNKNEFDIISSLSKIASFYCPEKYTIYDSRVVYSLNWFIFINKIDSKFFPQPIGRNKTMEEYNQKTIFNLSERKIEYYEPQESYIVYCELLNQIAMYNSNIKNYNIEMFLFSIADNLVIEDIKSSLKISIKNE